MIGTEEEEEEEGAAVVDELAVRFVELLSSNVAEVWVVEEEGNAREEGVVVWFDREKDCEVLEYNTLELLTLDHVHQAL